MLGPNFELAHLLKGKAVKILKHENLRIIREAKSLNQNQPSCKVTTKGKYMKPLTEHETGSKEK
jgi:hypothetical protein